MSKCIKDNTNCSGCGVCTSKCPKGAITLIADKKGFYRPYVDEKCIDCGICVKFCHELKPINANNVKMAFTAYSANSAVRAVSSSGGVFTELASVIIGQGGFVCAAGFDHNFHLRHRIVESVDDLDSLRQSKYLESDISIIWDALKQRVKAGQKGLFVGTPCQCAALHSFLGNDLKNIIVCDFICHGVGSPLVFDKYKSYLTGIYGTPKKIEFRHKEHGEGSFFLFEGNEGKYMIPNYTRSYPYAFASGQIIAEDCTKCRYSTLERYSDITLGDYVSGVTDYSKSTIFVNTENGNKILRSCTNVTLQEENLDEVIKKSWHLTMPNTNDPLRDKVFSDLNLPWEQLEKKYFHPLSRFQVYKNALYNKLKNILKNNERDNQA